jgi:cell wall-associated NlpC family hydrolase
MHWADRYIKTPFKDGGRDSLGADCWGLVRMVYRNECDIELPLHGAISSTELAKIAEQVATDASDANTWLPVIGTPQEYDVCVMQWYGRHIEGHVGVMVDHHRVLHTEAHVGAMIVPVTHPFVSKRIKYFRRHKAIA